jgi:putative phosphoesterase
MRYDIISDTHGYLSDELLAQLEGADYILHAGDCCSVSDYERLWNFAPVAMCVGNNDYYLDYGPEVKPLKRIYSSCLRWEICHYEERLDLSTCEIAICGHTHHPVIKRVGDVLVINPGSPTHPRGHEGATMARLVVSDEGELESSEIIKLAARKRTFF